MFERHTAVVGVPGEPEVVSGEANEGVERITRGVQAVAV
jgi:hypothetical protein